MLSILRDEGKITFKQEDQLKKIRKNIKELVIQTKKGNGGEFKGN